MDLEDPDGWPPTDSINGENSHTKWSITIKHTMMSTPMRALFLESSTHVWMMLKWPGLRLSAHCEEGGGAVHCVHRPACLHNSSGEYTLSPFCICGCWRENDSGWDLNSGLSNTSIRVAKCMLRRLCASLEFTKTENDVNPEFGKRVQI